MNINLKTVSKNIYYHYNINATTEILRLITGVPWQVYIDKDFLSSMHEK